MKQVKRLKKDPSPRFETRLGRLYWAMHLAEIDRTTFDRDLRRLAGTTLQTVDEWCAEAILAASELLKCDSRWLALGIESDACTAARVTISRADCGKVALERLDSFLATIQEPDRGFGICRYCGCTDFACCVGDNRCRFVDELETICSACLEGVR